MKQLHEIARQIAVGAWPKDRRMRVNCHQPRGSLDLHPAPNRARKVLCLHNLTGLHLISSGASRWNTYIFSPIPDSILLSRAALRAARYCRVDHTRAVKYIDHPFVQGADGVRVLAAAQGIEPLFAYHALRCVRLPDKGYSRHFKFLKATQFPIAPLAEQRRIVTKIDSLSVRSRRARDQLNHVPRLVEKYKQAILAAAFQGELASEWRSLSHIAASKHVPLHAICTSIADGDHQAPPRAETGIPFITISSMNDGVIDLGKATRSVPQSYFDNLKPIRRPSLGDVLYSVTGSFGISALVRFDKPFVFQRHIAILKPDRSKVDPQFLYRLLAAPQMMDQAPPGDHGTKTTFGTY